MFHRLLSLIVVLIFAAPLLAEPDASKGYWALEKQFIAGGETKGSDAYPFHWYGHWGAVVLQSSWDDHKFTIGCSWTNPPAKLGPGDVVEISLSSTVLANNFDRFIFNAGVNATMGCEPDARDLGLQFWDDLDPAKQTKKAIGFNQDAPKGTTASFVGKARVPGPSSGDRLQIRVGMAVNESFDARYTYVWVAPGATPPALPETPAAVAAPANATKIDWAPPSETPRQTKRNKKPARDDSPRDAAPRVELPVGPVAAAKPTVQAGSARVVAGQAVSVPVWLVCSKDIDHVNVVVHYDPNVVKPGAIDAGDPIEPTTAYASNSSQPGVIQFAFAGSASLLKADGPIANLTFTAIGKPGDKTTLQITITELGTGAKNQSAPAAVNGTIVIADANDQLPGDADGDGALTVADAIAALRMSVNEVPVDLICDLNHDGKVTPADASLILRKMAEK